MIYATSYDDNTDNWAVREWETALAPGPEAGLQFICYLQDADEDGPPIGPLRFSGDANRFILISAWTYGRQWFKMLTILSTNPVPEDEREASREHLPSEEDEYELDDEDDWDSEEE